MKRKTDLFIILYPRGRNRWDGREQVSHWWGSEGRREEEQMTEGGEVEHSALYWLGRGLLPSDVPPLVSHFLKKKKKATAKKEIARIKGEGNQLWQKRGKSFTKVKKCDENPFKCLWPNLFCFMNQWSSTSSEILVLHNFSRLANNCAAVKMFPQTNTTNIYFILFFLNKMTLGGEHPQL